MNYRITISNKTGNLVENHIIDVPDDRRLNDHVYLMKLIAGKYYKKMEDYDAYHIETIDPL